MNYRPLGNTGMQVSEIGLGGWQLANTIDWNPISPERIIQRSLETGCNFFDTSPAYGCGKSEELLGHVLKSVRNEVIISSKFGYNIDGQFGFDVKFLRPSLEDSLRRLQTDYIDIFLLHSPTTEMIMNDLSEQFEDLERLKTEGKIRAYGVSVWSSLEIEMLLKKTGSQVFEVHFNAFDQEPLPAFPQAYEQGAGIIIKSPLDTGWLAGIYSRNNNFFGSRTRWSQDEINRRFYLAEKFADLLPKDISMSQAALQFCLAQPEVSTVIPGAETVEQVIDNFSAINKQLAPDVIQSIYDLWKNEIASDRLRW